MLKYTNDYLPSKTTDQNILCNKTTVVCPESIWNSFVLQYKNNIINGNCAKFFFFSANKEYTNETFYGVRQLKYVTLNMMTKSLLNDFIFLFICKQDLIE